MTKPEHISSILRRAREELYKYLRNDFDQADDEKARELIETATDCGLHDLASEMQNDLDFEKQQRRNEQKDLEDKLPPMPCRTPTPFWYEQVPK